MIRNIKKLSNGLEIPTVGLGTSNLSSVTESVLQALDVGYRHIDTAKLYGNEDEIGEALRKTSVSREEIFITTKLQRNDLGYESAHENFKTSLQRLGLEYVDLYLIHWPGEDDAIAGRGDSWRALEETYDSGVAKAIGVSNFTTRHMREMEDYKIMPMVNQIEFHPFLYETHTDIHQYCYKHDILVISYSPLMHGNELRHSVIEHIAKNHARTAGQILLRWNIQHGNAVIPKSSGDKHLRENLEIFDFQLDEEDMQSLDAIGENRSFMFS